MGKLVLTSGGYLDGERGKECDKIIEELTKNKRVIFIDNATLTGSNKKGIPIILNIFNNIVKSIEQISINERNIQTINNYDVLYITGGDLLPFLQLFEKCSLLENFSCYLKQGGNIIGESVGYMIFGKDLKCVYEIKKETKPKYDVELSSYKGLGLVDINFFPHYNKASDEMKQKVLEYQNKNNLVISRVCDNDFIVVDVN